MGLIIFILWIHFFSRWYYFQELRLKEIAGLSFQRYEALLIWLKAFSQSLSSHYFLSKCSIMGEDITYGQLLCISLQS